MVLIRLKGVLTPAERHLAKGADGTQFNKQKRAKLLDNSSQLLENVIMKVAGIGVVSFLTAISTKEGERVIIVPLGRILIQMSFAFL